MAVLLLWRVQAEAGSGLELHFLGVTALTLLLGWPFAILVVMFVVLGLTVNCNVPGSTFALHVLILGALPAILTHLLLQVQRAFFHPISSYIRFLTDFSVPPWRVPPRFWHWSCRSRSAGRLAGIRLPANISDSCRWC